MESPNEPVETKAVPSTFQRRTLWIAITAFSLVLIGAVAVGFVMLTGTVLSYLQPVLVPVAVAAIIAYLLEPIVKWLEGRGWSHSRAMMAVFIAFMVLIVMLVVGVVVPSVGQAKEAYDKRDEYRERATELVQRGIDSFQEKFDTGIAQEYYDSGVEWISTEGPNIASSVGQWLWSRLSGFFGFFGYVLGLLLVPIYLFYFLREGHKISHSWSDYLPLRASSFKDEVVGTLTEVNGYLISFFRGQMVVSLIDGALIAAALTLIQLPYALLIGVFLAILGLIPFIGNLLVMIPAVIIAIAHFGASEWVVIEADTEPAVGSVIEVKVGDEKRAHKRVITEVKPFVAGKAGEEEAAPETADSAEASPETTATEGAAPEAAGPAGEASGGKYRVQVLVNAWTWMPHIWFYPLLVILIFVVLQQINSLVTAPKIVGDSVGLHPLTVIFSILFWSLLLGGLLGALLAVPLTAAIKVLFRRYIWMRRIEPAVRHGRDGPEGGAGSVEMSDTGLPDDSDPGAESGPAPEPA